MDKVKVRDFVGAYSRALNLDSKVEGVLVELMESIILKYEPVIPAIPVSMDKSNVYIIKPINGEYSVEDFFLNRLMRNVWCVGDITSFDIDNNFSDANTKGQFDPRHNEVSFNRYKVQNQMSKFKSILGDDYDRHLDTAIKKVVMHEFEHALKTSYNDELDFNYRPTYKVISDEVSKLSRYAGRLKTYEEMKKDYSDTSTYIFAGVRYNKRIAKGIKTYREVDGIEELDEILNESESLDVSGHNCSLSLQLGNNTSILLRNPESSNRSITNYGYIIKSLMGEKNAFRMMYLDPNYGFEFFNSMYGDIFRMEYGSDSDGIEILCSILSDLKKSNSAEAHLKFCSVLTKCLEKKVDIAIKEGKTSSDIMLKTIDLFDSLMVSSTEPSKRKKFDHVRTLDNLRNKLSCKDNKMTIPTFEEVKKSVILYRLDSEQGNSFRVIDRKSGKEISDPRVVSLATFSNLWLFAAGTKFVESDVVDGEFYAFSDAAKRVYDFVCSSIVTDLTSTGNINTVNIFENSDLLGYKYSRDIVFNLFRSDYQADFMDTFFRQRCNSALPKTKKPEPFYSYEYLGRLINKNELNTNSLTPNQKNS